MATVPIVLEVTYDELANSETGLIANNELNLALSYKITDRGDRGLLFRAAAPNRLENDGLRYMLCPATYATGEDAYSNDWIGVWNAVKQTTATTGQLTIWNGLVWVAGAVLSGDSPDTEASGWTVIPKASFANHEYVEMIFGVTFDFENNWINKQWDKRGNKCGLIKMDALNYGFDFNPVDYFSWNLIGLPNFYFSNNEMAYEINCVFSEDGYYSENKFIGGISQITVNTLNRNYIDKIENCSGFYSIDHNCNFNLSIVDATAIVGGLNICRNSNNGVIEGTFDADVEEPIVDKEGIAE